MDINERVKKGLHHHCECSLFDRCTDCPYYKLDFSSTAGIDCRDALIMDINILFTEPDCRVCAQTHCRYYHNTMKPKECKSFVKAD